MSYGRRIVKNAAWIIACKIVQSVLGLIITMLTARYLGPSNYGLINYAASLVAFVTPIMQLGLNSILVQEIINAPEKEGEILGTALAMSLFSSIISIGGVVSFTAIANHNEKETILVCTLYSILLIFQGLEMIEYWFQAKLLSKYASITSLLAYSVISAYKIYLLASGKNIYWFAVSNAFDFLLIAITLLIIYKKLGNSKLSFSLIRAKQMFGKGRYYIVSSLMVTLFAQTDRVMLKLMVNDTATGYFSAAVACASITSFVFSAIIDSARPSIFESKLSNQAGFEKNISRLYSIIIYFALLQSAAITILSEIIVHIIYGAEYGPAIPALRLIVWYTTFSYLGSVRNIWILAEGKQKYLWIINLSGALINILLNALLIPIWGIMGAAFTSLFTQIFTNVIVGFIIRPISYNNNLILRGLNPKCLIEALNMVKSAHKEKRG